MNKKRIIACIAYLHGAGGAERQIIMLSNALAEKGNEVHLLIMVDNKSRYHISDKVKQHDLTTIENDVGNNILKRFRALKKELKIIHPDITIHFWLQSAYFAAMMNKKNIGKVVYAERGDPGDSEYAGLLGFVRKIAFSRVDGFVFQSEGARDYFKSRIREKSIIIHNAVSVPSDKYLCPCETKVNRIINVGRLHPQKNQKLMIKSFAIFSRYFPDYYLEIVGDGEMKDELQALAIKLNIQEKVVFSPSRNDIFDEMYSSKMLVLSSDYEGMPNVLLEAMSLGVLCISCDCKPGGARTLINDGVNGYIVPRNNTETLAEKMIDVISNYHLQLDVCKKAQEIRESHTAEKIYEIWEKYLINL